jgi:hypothetical protein
VLTTLALLYLLGALAEAPASARFAMSEPANRMASAAALVTSPLDIGFSRRLKALSLSVMFREKMRQISLIRNN